MKSNFWKVSVEDGHGQELECHYYRLPTNAVKFAQARAEKLCGGIHKQLDGVGLCQAEIITKRGEIIWVWKETFQD